MRLQIWVEPSIAARATASAAHCAGSTKWMYVWDVIPSIPLGAPVNRWRLRDLFALTDDLVNSLAIFLCRRQSNSCSTEWTPQVFLDPALTPFQLGLREEMSCCCFVTTFPEVVIQANSTKKRKLTAASASLELKKWEMEETIGGAVWFQSPKAPLDDEDEDDFIVPFPTAALRFTIFGDAMKSSGKSHRRVIRTQGPNGGNVHWSSAAVAAAAFPEATFCVPPSAATRLRDERSPAAAALHGEQEGSSLLHWAMRVAYSADNPTNGTSHRPCVRGEKFFADDVSDDEEGEDDRGDGADDDDLRDSPGNQVLSAVIEETRKDPRNERNEESGCDDEDSSLENMIGVPLPSVLLGFGLRKDIETFLDSTRSAVSDKSGKSVPLYMEPHLARAAFFFEPMTGFFYGSATPPSSSPAGASEGGASRDLVQLPAPMACADLDSLQYQIGSTFTFVVDIGSGAVNIVQDSRTVLVTRLPSDFVDMLSIEIDHHLELSSATELHSRSTQAAVMSSLAMIVQIGTLWGCVDIF